MQGLDSDLDIQHLTSYFKKVRFASLAIAAPLSEEDMQVQSMTDASPVKWHLAHTSWVFETFVLKPYLENYPIFDAQYEYLFNSYYNAVGEQFPRAKRGLLSRPNYQRVLQYREHVDKQMHRLLDPNNKNQLSAKCHHLIKLAINHEQQHQELMLTDVKHALSINPDYPIYRPCEPPEYLQTELLWRNFSAGLYQIGHQNEAFYFDNEGPPHQVYLQTFQLASRLVSCGEYIDFIEDGGYEKPEHWLSEAWGKINSENIGSPLYWQKKGGEWLHYTLSGLTPIDRNAPAMHINYFEANAYANSLNKRLPTEQEWEVASRTIDIDTSKPIDNGDQYQLHPRSADGQQPLEQMFGQLWQWTSSSYNAYPGFKVPDGAIGEYNGKFMVNQYVLRGGSIATAKGHIRHSYRNFFYPDASWQFSGIRLAESL